MRYMDGTVGLRVDAERSRSGEGSLNALKRMLALDGLFGIDMVVPTFITVAHHVVYYGTAVWVPAPLKLDSMLRRSRKVDA